MIYINKNHTLLDNQLYLEKQNIKNDNRYMYSQDKSIKIEPVDTVKMLKRGFETFVYQIKQSELLDPRIKCHLLLYIYSYGQATEYESLFHWFLCEIGIPEKYTEMKIEFTVDKINPSGTILYDEYFVYLFFSNGSCRIYEQGTNLSIGLYNHSNQTLYTLKTMNNTVLKSYLFNILHR